MKPTHDLIGDLLEKSIISLILDEFGLIDLDPDKETDGGKKQSQFGDESADMRFT